MNALNRIALCLFAFLLASNGAPAQPLPSTQLQSNSASHAAALAAAENEPFPASPFQPDLTPGYVLVEGDIQIRLDLYIAITSGAPDSTYGTVNYWPAGVVPYDFVTAGGGAVSAANQTSAVNAMNAISAVAGTTFRPAIAADTSRIRFQNSSFNNSAVGRQGGVQIINIFNWGTQIIMVHELYHSLGFWHEQSRPDRATYITINTNNICGSGISAACTAGTGAGQCCLCVNTAGACISCAFNFNVQAGTSTYGWYDFDSFMHYARADFSCNGADTITVNAPWNSQWQSRIGQRDHFSYLDTITCRGLYPFAADRWVDANYFGAQSGTFLQPWNVSFLSAAAFTPVGGALFLNPGTYSAVGTVYNSPAYVGAPLGGVTIH